MNHSRTVSKITPFVCALLLSGSIFRAQALDIPRLPPPNLVAPIMIAPQARLPIRLEKAGIEAEVIGSFAHTRIELVFRNPNERTLEGQLQFPLLAGQIVSGFALDIDGELRPAVPVEKSLGQQAFEDLSRAKIDPALLEKTQGNNYKLRVYPLPAHATRTVVLEIEQSLPVGAAAAKGARSTTYRLPLGFGETVKQLDVSVHNAAVPAHPSARAVRATLGAEKIKVSYAPDEDSRDGSLIRFSRRNYSGNELLSIDFPDSPAPFYVTGTRDDQRYFYAEVPAPAGKPAPRAAPKKLGLVWDASGSGASRDHGREFALLDAYFKTLRAVDVELVVARDAAMAPQSFPIRDGNWSRLREALEKMAYDGATSAAALSPPKAVDLSLLFSDGLINFGVGAFDSGNAPWYAVNSAAAADLERLRAAAETSGGRLLDLLSVSTNDALDQLTHRYPRLAGIHSNGAKELVSAASYADGKRLKIAGILTDPEAAIILDWVDAQGATKAQQIAIRNKSGNPLAPNRWAALQLAQLETEPEANRAAILRLGKRFGMLTKNTSLIVLDRVEDYVRYEITPPESLRGEYERMLARRNRQQTDDQASHLDEIAARFAKKVAWWEKDFPKGDIPALPKIKEGERDRRELIPLAATAPSPVLEAVPVPMPARMAMAAAPAPAPSPAQADVSAAARIELKKWQPDSPYARRLREASVDEMYRIYLDERPEYVNSTAFFLDAADIFIERGQAELGLRILSNLAEMNLENRQILRILAYRLLQAKQSALALPILRQVLALSPNEPQSWRDLGLAYAENGDYQAAVDNLWQVVERPWNDRFPDIELIALAELNAIVARAPKGAVDTSRMDQRLLRNLPLDIRAVLAWDADNTDIDLWVTDPNNEKVYYAHRLSYQGGANSRDFTGGYGPEEFSLRHAKPGKYRVQAQFYGNRQQLVAGATTLMLRLSTGFGTAAQHDENIILRLPGQGSVVDVGTFEIGK